MFLIFIKFYLLICVIGVLVVVVSWFLELKYKKMLINCLILIFFGMKCLGSKVVLYFFVFKKILNLVNFIIFKLLI